MRNQNNESRQYTIEEKNEGIYQRVVHVLILFYYWDLLISKMFWCMLCLETDSWELVDTEANAYPGDVVEYKVAKAQNGLLTESMWTTGTVYVWPQQTL